MMIILLLFSLASVSLADEGVNCECGLSTKEPSFANGSFVDEERYPWIVRVKMPQMETKLGPWIRDCSGVLISPFHIVTAMACGFGMEKQKLEIWYGKYMIAESKSIWPWNKPKPTIYFKNPKFALISRLLNIIELQDPIELSKEVRPICVPDSHDMENIDKLVYTDWEIQTQGKKTIQIIKQFTFNGKDLKIYGDDGYKPTKRVELIYGQGSPLMYFENGRWYLAGISCILSGFNPTTKEILLNPDSKSLEKARDFNMDKLRAQVQLCQK